MALQRYYTHVQALVRSSLRRDTCRWHRVIFSLGWLALCGPWLGCGRQTKPFDLSQASYVGRSSCIGCHAEQASLHSGSHHDLAMQPANESTVLGDFDDAVLEWQGISNRMYRVGDRFMVRTEGPSGTLEDFEVRYVFGVEPLQQYMVEFPPAEAATNPPATNPPAANPPAATAVPRVQVLPICWNTESKSWFHLTPPDVSERLEPNDDLHWTGIAQRWNTMCADCHSTNYAKNFQSPAHPVAQRTAYASSPTASPTSVSTQPNVSESIATAVAVSEPTVSEPPPSEPPPPASQPTMLGHYESTFSEIDVSCEACHGPGSVHVELAGHLLPGWSRQRGYGLADLKSSAEGEIQACAPCHSRRSIVYPGFRAGDNYYDHYANALLIEPVYYADGQVWDEDYVHGSFIQSKMYHKGIRCSDCHDPHTARLKHEGNAVCTSCHQHPAAKYDTVAHHFHSGVRGDVVGSGGGTSAVVGNGTQCVDCHMPATVYMQCDSRRDHSLRIPRPDLSIRLGTPNACTGCHLELDQVASDKAPQLKRYQDWLQAAREGDAEVQRELDRANQWCDAACDQWYGETRRRDEHFGIALHAAQQPAPGAEQQLVQLLRRRGEAAPALARATALELLLRIDPRLAAEEGAIAIADEHPLVRRQAAAALLGAPQDSRTTQLLRDALADPVRGVRTQAARSLLQIDPSRSLGSDNHLLRAALKEVQENLLASNDHAGAHVDLGAIAEQQGLHQQAIKHYETAIAVEPGFVGPRSNLASLLERLSQTQSAVAPAIAEQVKTLRQSELPLIARDAQLLPEAAELQYRYALALYLDGQLERAAERAVAAAELDARVVEYAQMASLLSQSLGKREAAIRWAESAVQRSGNAPESLNLLDSVRAK